MMQIFLSLLAGLLWGAAAAALNAAITRALSKKSEKGMMAASLLHLPVDVAALGAVYLARNVLPLRFELTMIAAAGAMSVVTIIAAFSLARR